MRLLSHLRKTMDIDFTVASPPAPVATAHPFPTHSTPFCLASGISAYTYSFWIPMLFSECVLCALAVSRFFHMHHTRGGATLFQNGRRLVGALIRDSVWYFVV